MAYAALTSLMGTIHLHFLQSQPRFPLQDLEAQLRDDSENLGMEEESEITGDDAAMKDVEEHISQGSSSKGWTKRLLRVKAGLRRLHRIFNKQTDYPKGLIKIKSEYQLVNSSSRNERITDTWTTIARDSVQSCFPEDNNGSQILLTPSLVAEVKQEMLSLHQNLGFLQQILEKSEIAYDNVAMKHLEAEIRDVSFKAEERIEMELTSIYLQPSSVEACLLRLHGILNQALKQTDYLKKKLIKIKSEKQLEKGSSITGVSLPGSTPSQPYLEREKIPVSKISKTASKFDSRMVGCNDEFKKIMDQLTQQSVKQRRVVSTVGMGGIGKTTLARKVYEHPSITSHYYMRAWVSVSQEYNVEQMLRCLIGCVSASSGEVHDQDQLAERLYKLLKGQRYLIVIDDIWSTSAWDSVQRCFPDENNGSRILLTSRLREVAEYASSGNSPLNMPFLDADESWDLYCKMFGKTEFPFEFEQIGRDIVKKCKGLPLAIVVVASLLSRTEEKVEKWNNVAENISKLLIGDADEGCSRILFLSYIQLPHHLKACFLYLGIFPEDYEIPVKKLVRLWAAEGFLGAVKHQSMEEVAMECLQDLVDRSLVLVSKQSYNGKIKTIRMHDLLRELCLREAQCENLLNVIGRFKRFQNVVLG